MDILLNRDHEQLLSQMPDPEDVLPLRQKRAELVAAFNAAGFGDLQIAGFSSYRSADNVRSSVRGTGVETALDALFQALGVTGTGGLGSGPDEVLAAHVFVVSRGRMRIGMAAPRGRIPGLLREGVEVDIKFAAQGRWPFVRSVGHELKWSSEAARDFVKSNPALWKIFRRNTVRLDVNRDSR